MSISNFFQPNQFDPIYIKGLKGVNGVLDISGTDVTIDQNLTVDGLINGTIVYPPGSIPIASLSPGAPSTILNTSDLGVVEWGGINLNNIPPGQNNQVLTTVGPAVVWANHGDTNINNTITDTIVGGLNVYKISNSNETNYVNCDESSHMQLVNASGTTTVEATNFDVNCTNEVNIYTNSDESTSVQMTNNDLTLQGGSSDATNSEILLEDNGISCIAGTSITLTAPLISFPSISNTTTSNILYFDTGLHNLTYGSNNAVMSVNNPLSGITLVDNTISSQNPIVKSLVAGSNVTVTATGTDNITIGTSGVVTSVTSGGSGQTLVDDTDTANPIIYSLGNGAGISLSAVSDEVTIANTGILSVSNAAGAVTLADLTTPNEPILKSLNPGTGVSMTVVSDSITINNTGVLSVNNPVSGVTLVDNTSATVPIVKSLVSGTGLSVTATGTDNVTLANTGVLSVNNPVSGITLVDNTSASAPIIKSLVGSTNLTVTATGTDNVTLATTGLVTGISNGGAGQTLVDNTTTTAPKIYSLSSGSGIGLTASSDNVAIANTGVLSVNNPVSGITLVDNTSVSAPIIKSLVAGAGMSVTATGTDNVTVANTSNPTPILYQVASTVTVGDNIIYKIGDNDESNYVYVNQVANTITMNAATQATIQTTAGGTVELNAGAAGSVLIPNLASSSTTNLLEYNTGTGALSYYPDPLLTGASLVLSANFNITTSSYIYLPSTTTYNSVAAAGLFNSGLVNLSTGVITPPVTGHYLLCMNLVITDSGAGYLTPYQLQMGVYNNTSSTSILLFYYTIDSPNEMTKSFSNVLNLSSGSTYSFFLGYSHSSGAVVDLITSVVVQRLT